MVHVSGRLAPNEYLKALYLHHRPPQLLRLGFPLFLVVYGVAVLFYGASHFSSIEVTVLLFPLFLIWVWNIVGLPKHGVALFSQNVTLGYWYEFALTSERLKISSKLEESELSWSEFSHYKVNRLMTLLYCSESEFYVFPARWFEIPEDLGFFHDCLQSSLGPPRR